MSCVNLSNRKVLESSVRKLLRSCIMVSQMYNVFLLSSKTIPFEQYYRLHLSGPNVAICETNSSNVFVLSQTSFSKNNFYFLHAVQEAVDAFTDVLKDFGFFQRLASYDPSKHPTHPTLPPTLKISNLAFCNRLSIFADFLRSSFIFPDFLRRFSSQFIHIRRRSSQFLHLGRLSSQFVIFADFLCSPLNMNSLTFKLQIVSNCFQTGDTTRAAILCLSTRTDNCVTRIYCPFWEK